MSDGLLAIENRSAVFSPCRTWRYSLTRVWDPSLPSVNFLGLNPSTADETHDDPTIRRCLGFVRRWGYGALVMTNLFAFRATDPAEMQAAWVATGVNVIGPENDHHLVEQARRAGLVLAAWGAGGEWCGRAIHVQVLLGATYGIRLHALGWTKAGHPRHPLYMRADTRPEAFP